MGSRRLVKTLVEESRAFLKSHASPNALNLLLTGSWNSALLHCKACSIKMFSRHYWRHSVSRFIVTFTTTGGLIVLSPVCPCQRMIW